LGTDVTLASVEYHGESFTSPQYYGYRLTWFSRKRSWLGVEAEFVHPKAFADTGRVTRASGQVGGMRIEQPVPVGSVIERFSISHGLNMVLFNAVARHAFGSRGTRARVVVAGRFGAGPTIPHAESTIEGRQSAEGYAWGAPVWQAAAGVQVRLVTRLDAVSEYKFTRTRQSVDVDRGKADGVFASHHIVFGLSWHLTRDR
jgi:opacity protein-like surface antigen